MAQRYHDSSARPGRELFQIIHALFSPGCFAHGLNRRQQKRDQNSDDRDDNQEFDQCEPVRDSGIEFAHRLAPPTDEKCRRSSAASVPFWNRPSKYKPSPDPANNITDRVWQSKLMLDAGVGHVGGGVGGVMGCWWRSVGIGGVWCAGWRQAASGCGWRWITALARGRFVTRKWVRNYKFCGACWLGACTPQAFSIDVGRPLNWSGET